MLVLGIETSCDDTGLALVNEEGLVESALASQSTIHDLFGGVVPELASREHARCIGPLLDSLWEKSGLNLSDIDAIAVTRGPGLLGSLLVGVSFAKALAFGKNIPLVGVNHLHAHLLVSGLENTIKYPALGVLISGGHTHLFEIKDPFTFTVLGKSIDDAAGEACDKFGKVLGLPYPSGALLDTLAQMGNIEAKLFPRPYIRNDNLDFSFSGLKTAGNAWISAHPDAILPVAQLGKMYTAEDMVQAPQVLKNGAASYIHAIADTLKIKAQRAINKLKKEAKEINSIEINSTDEKSTGTSSTGTNFTSRASANENSTGKNSKNVHSIKEIQSIIVAGGVAANSFIRKEFQDLAHTNDLELYIPSMNFCMDNGIMVAYAGYLLLQNGYQHTLDLNAIPKGQAIPQDYVQTYENANYIN